VPEPFATQANGSRPAGSVRHRTAMTIHGAAGSVTVRDLCGHQNRKPPSRAKSRPQAALAFLGVIGLVCWHWRPGQDS
jgi:hypothetical protein